MTSDQVLLAQLAALVGANVLLVVMIAVRALRQRRSASRPRTRATSPTDPARGGDATASEDARLAGAIEAYVAGISADDLGRTRPAAGSDPIVARREAVPRGQEWTLVDVADLATWSRTIREESARVARFGHPVTVVMAEVPHLDILTDRFGRGVADRVVTAAARSLVSESRAADRIARLGEARFGILLPETDETAAGAYVERVRAAIDGWLQSTGLSTRVSLGCAGPLEGGGVIAAAAVAEQRMHDADRRRGPGPALVSSAPEGTSANKS